MYVKYLPVPVQMSVSGSWKLQIQGLVRGGRQHQCRQAVFWHYQYSQSRTLCTDALLWTGNGHHHEGRLYPPFGKTLADTF